uniref:Uncharacterized protein n=1 Tax=Pithovirus LCPAC406 TaxID=2506599 RepID=A0A481ZEM3_9VIRU|nr:MAG: hypothetical protein LCPAC406_03700 [Pithovirus LCPAC406]
MIFISKEVGEYGSYSICKECRNIAIGKIDLFEILFLKEKDDEVSVSKKWTSSD